MAEKVICKVPCKFCRKEKEIRMTEEQLEMLTKFQNGEGHIQDLLPEVSKEIREMFISGMCPDCWKQIFR